MKQLRMYREKFQFGKKKSLFSEASLCQLIEIADYALTASLIALPALNAGTLAAAI